MRYLSAQDILILHALLVDETGGSHGIRDIGLLQSIERKPKSSFVEKELYPGVFLKAAILLEAIANYHIFVDGNKRTAFVAAAHFLAVNGYEIMATNKDVEKTILSVAEKRLSVEKLSFWLKKNSKKKN
ncbi:MAG: type II toxin-antitoxin system death-on-curing family toxin [Patescibacteria group bacterium]